MYGRGLSNLHNPAKVLVTAEPFTMTSSLVGLRCLSRKWTWRPKEMIANTISSCQKRAVAVATPFLFLTRLASGTRRAEIHVNASVHLLAGITVQL